MMNRGERARAGHSRVASWHGFPGFTFLSTTLYSSLFGTELPIHSKKTQSLRVWAVAGYEINMIAALLWRMAIVGETGIYGLCACTAGTWKARCVLAGLAGLQAVRSSRSLAVR